MVTIALLCLNLTGCLSFIKDAQTQRQIHSRELTLGGIHAQQRGNDSHAESLFSKAVAACPDDHKARQKYAELLLKRGEVQNAVAHMEKAIESSNNDPEMIVQLGEIYFPIGDHQSSKVFAERALAGNQKNMEAWLLKANSCEQLGNPQGALQAYLRVLELDEKNANARFALAGVYQKLGKPQRALSNLAMIRRTFPPGQEPENLVLLEGEVLMAMNRNSEAATRISEIVDRESPSAKAFLTYSTILERLGDKTNSRLIMSRAMDLYPGSASIRERMAAMNQSGSAVTVAKVDSLETNQR